MTRKSTGNLLTTLKRRAYFSWINKLLHTYQKAEVYLVGGSVRDLILKRSTVDYDFVVRGLSPKILQRYLGRLGRVNLVGKRFGVYKFSPKGSKMIFDIALPRTERSRHKQGYHRDFVIVSDGNLSIKEDLKRRDFTINALAIRWPDGALIDEHAGLNDIASGTIRTVGSPVSRFREDYIRMLRAIRFASQLNFTIEDNTFEAIKQLGVRLKGASLPREPLASELVQAFSANAVQTFDLLCDTRLLVILIPELSRDNAVRHTRSALEMLASPAFIHKFPNYSPSSALIFAVLLHTTKSEGVVRRLKLSSVTPTVRSKQISWLTTQYPRALEAGISLQSRVMLENLYFRVDDPEGELLKLGWLMAQVYKKSKPTLLKNYQRTLKQLRLLAPRGRLAKSLISGDDVIKLGQSSGPQIAKILETVREGQLTKKVKTRPQALAFAKNILYS